VSLAVAESEADFLAARAVAPLRPRLWLVGESNPRGGDPSHALLAWPRGSAGDRLRVALGLSDLDYLCRFERRNLLDRGAWSARRAREAAEDLVRASRAAPLVLLGRRVAAAFGVEYLPFVIFADPQPKLVLPYPSGRCRAWNDPRAAARARTMVRELEALR
jgi:hypothetical protein